jgi:hypothetical protein
MTVIVRGDRIVSVGKGTPAPAGAQVIDGRGKFVMPGLWDMHSHLTDSRVGALPALVATGVLYVRDAGSGNLTELDEWRGQIASKAMLGPTIFRAGITLNGQESNAFHLVIANGPDARMAARTLKKAGMDFLKTHRRTSRDAYFALADEAKIGIPPHGQAAAVSLAEASDAGQQTISTPDAFEGRSRLPQRTRHGRGDGGMARIPDAAALSEFVCNHTVVINPGGNRRDPVGRSTPPTRPAVALHREVRPQRREAALAPIGAVQKRTCARLAERPHVTLQMQRAGVTSPPALTPPASARPLSLHDELSFVRRRPDARRRCAPRLSTARRCSLTDAASSPPASADLRCSPPIRSPTSATSTHPRCRRAAAC